MKYVGLTDDATSRKQAHGNPSDWWQRSFSTEKEARDWEKDMLSKPGYKGGTGGEGWRYGYTYAVGIVELKDGLKLTTQIVDTDLEKIQIGKKVKLVFRKIQDEGKWGLHCYGYKAVLV